MICKKCGNHIEPDALFCAMCGARADTIIPPGNIPEYSSDGEEIPAGYSQPSYNESGYREDVQINEEKRYVDSAEAFRGQDKQGEHQEEKYFFGVGAFVLCAVMIGLLSVSTGVFAALYFNAIGG